MEETPELSVVVCVYNRPEMVRRCLETILKADYPRSKYEVVVIDDGSTDETPEVAARYADRVVRQKKNLGIVRSRRNGALEAKGRVVLNIDSDVLVRPDTMSRVMGYLDTHPGVSGVTGLLSKEHPNRGFFSQYKNLYMNYIFRGLPENVEFLYGSIFAIRKPFAVADRRAKYHRTDDTGLGQELASQGRCMAFLRDLEVVHLKEYTFFSFFKNDFEIPFEWAMIFLRQRAWRRFGRNPSGRGFAHASHSQIAGVLLASAVALAVAASFFAGPWGGTIRAAAAAGLAVWAAMNARFIAFLAAERGPLFGLASVFVTFLDHVVMFAGIVCGALAYLKRSRAKEAAAALVAVFLLAAAPAVLASETELDYLEPGPGRIQQIGPGGSGYVVVKNPDGTKFLVLTDNLNKYLPGKVQPGEVGRTPVFGGLLRRIGELEAPDAEMPAELLDPPPSIAEGAEITDEYREKVKRRTALEQRHAKRWLVDTEDRSGQEIYHVQDLYDGDGVLLRSVREITSR